MDHYGDRIRKRFAELRVEHAPYGVPWGSLGVEVTAETDEIGKVAADSQAQKLKLGQGWHVVEVNEQPYTRELLTQVEKSGAPFRLQIRRHVPTREQMYVLE